MKEDTQHIFVVGEEIWKKNSECDTRTETPFARRWSRNRRKRTLYPNGMGWMPCNLLQQVRTSCEWGRVWQKIEYEGICQKSVPIIEKKGYVGLSIATLLSQHHQVTAVDIVPEKVELINNRKSPIQDDYMEKYLAEKELNLTATLDAKTAYIDAGFVVIAAPTNVRPTQFAEVGLLSKVNKKHTKCWKGYYC